MNNQSNLLTRNETYEEDTDLDAEEFLDAEKVKVTRGMSKEYVKIETLVDYQTALNFMKSNMPDYEFRYKKEK